METFVGFCLALVVTGVLVAVAIWASLPERPEPKKLNKYMVVETILRTRLSLTVKFQLVCWIGEGERLEHVHRRAVDLHYNPRANVYISINLRSAQKAKDLLRAFIHQCRNDDLAEEAKTLLVAKERV